jgi:hypothetical protein
MFQEAPLGAERSGWQPGPAARERVDCLMHVYRQRVAAHLAPIVQSYNPRLVSDSGMEYRKMLELSTKMTLVGHACTEIADQPFDDRRQTIAGLFGACCFLADSFLDDFGEAATREYLSRFELLFTKGWFEVRNDRERLFYVIIARLFAERNILEPTLRQALLRLFEAQRRDVDMRYSLLQALPRRKHLQLLKNCARDRSGHAIIVLSAFLVPGVSLEYIRLIFTAGALIMFIDDHGDSFADLADGRITYMNQLAQPRRALRRIFYSQVDRLTRGLPLGDGRDLLIAFLTRYYLTRLEKHRQQRNRGGSAWAVYE